MSRRSVRDRLSQVAKWLVHNTIRHPLSLLIIFDIVLFLFITYTPPNIKSGNLDAFVLGYISVIYLFAAVYMAVNTAWKNWTILSSGLLAKFLGSVILYGSTTYIYFYGPYYHYNTALNAVRVLFIVGGTWIFIGLIQGKWLERGYTLSSIGTVLRNPLKALHIRRNKNV